MRVFLVLAFMMTALAACTSAGDSSGGFTRSSDTYGTNRRPDVDYTFTRPTLPTVLDR